jgi:plasmid stabilization system protein ParE
MRVRYTVRALADLEQTYEYFEKRRPATAQSLKSTIERQIGWLTNIPPRGDGNSLVQRDRAEQVRELLGSAIRHHQTLAGIHNGRTVRFCPLLYRDPVDRPTAASSTWRMKR